MTKARVCETIRIPDLRSGSSRQTLLAMGMSTDLTTNDDYCESIGVGAIRRWCPCVPATTITGPTMFAATPPAISSPTKTTGTAAITCPSPQPTSIVTFSTPKTSAGKATTTRPSPQLTSTWTSTPTTTTTTAQALAQDHDHIGAEQNDPVDEDDKLGSNDAVHYFWPRRPQGRLVRQAYRQDLPVTTSSAGGASAPTRTQRTSSS